MHGLTLGSRGAELQQEFALSAREIQLHGLARRYLDETDAFDRSVCTGRNAAPASARELFLVARHARSVREHIGHIAASAGFTNQELRAAIALLANSRPTR